jgi:hypothetical protein
MSQPKKQPPKLSYVSLWCGNPFNWSTVNGISSVIAHSRQNGPSGNFQAVCNTVDQLTGVIPIPEAEFLLHSALAEMAKMTPTQRKSSYWLATQSRPTIITVTPETQEMYDQRMLEKKRGDKLSLLERLRTAEAAAASARQAIAALGLPEEEEVG